MNLSFFQIIEPKPDIKKPKKVFKDNSYHFVFFFGSEN